MRFPSVILYIRLLILGLALMHWISPANAARGQFNKMVDQAKELAEQPFVDPSTQELPPELSKIGYDQWRDIRYNPEQALWRDTDSSFQVQFFHMGFLFKWPVKMSVIDNKRRNTIPFTPELFDYGPSGLEGTIPKEFSFSGLRVHYPINRPDYYDEVIAFLGASYFRAVAKNLAYGLSARGLAINTGLSSGEEFPFFKEFWIERPPSKADSIVIYALLDSRSVTGAFEFMVRPGIETVIDVQSVFFAREDIEKLGIAPLTSMYFFGENQRWIQTDDFRPEVHDSDGLLVYAENGEWIWRPLVNPERLSINTFNGNNVRGFGLLQRDGNFDHYQDLEARSDIRPSAWVEPKGHWGDGHVELVEIPTTNEYNDNINAYWVPAQPLKAGERAEYRYTLRWFRPTPKPPVRGHVTDTRMVRENNNENFLFVIEFTGDKLKALPDGTHLHPDIHISGGYTLQDAQVIKNKITEGWRLVFRLKRGDRDLLKDMIPSQKPAVDIRAVLKQDDLPITETWIYSFRP